MIANQYDDDDGSSDADDVGDGGSDSDDDGIANLPQLTLPYVRWRRLHGQWRIKGETGDFRRQETPVLHGLDQSQREAVVRASEARVSNAITSRIRKSAAAA